MRVVTENRQCILPLRRDGLDAGVDEAGRGPLAGPVFAAAVVLDPKRRIRGLKDSKLLTPKRRECLADRICSRALAWAVAWADEEEIDALNILQATLLAMRRAVQGLAVRPNHINVDGRHCPAIASPWLVCTVDAVIGGDRTVPAISAASILAKVHRDRRMRRLDVVYPEYGFACHKGYATRAHLDALNLHGPCRIHRRSFAPVRQLVEERP